MSISILHALTVWSETIGIQNQTSYTDIDIYAIDILWHVM